MSSLPSRYALYSLPYFSTDNASGMMEPLTKASWSELALHLHKTGNWMTTDEGIRSN